MPCSRSARRPSVSSARSSAPDPPLRSLACATCASWSSNTCLVSYSSRPISVLLPSSTAPAVVKRSKSRVTCAPVPTHARAARAREPCRQPLEVADLLAILHRGLGDLVVGPGLTALGDARGGDLEHDLFQRARLRTHATGAAHVADRAIAHRLGEDLLAVEQLGPLPPRVQHPVALEHLALVCEVARRDLQLLL